MLRAHSRILGRQILPINSFHSSPFASSSPRRAASSGHRRLCWTPFSAERPPEASWLARRTSRPHLHTCDSSFSLPWRFEMQPVAGGPKHSAAWTIPRALSSHRYVPVGVEDGSGSGSGNGNGIRGGGGGGGGGGEGGGGSGGGAGGAAGDDGKWRIWAWYLGLLDRRPILTKAVTSAVLTFVGDLFCQYLLEGADKVNVNRLAVMTFLGFGLVGPTLHFWYLTLSKLVTIGGPAGVGIRLILDQFVFSPTFIATFMSCLMTLEGNSTQISAKLKQDWLSAVVVNWQLWIPAQIINFWLVPQKLQVAFANFIALFWNAYLSYKSHIEVGSPQVLTTQGKA